MKNDFWALLNAEEYRGESLGASGQMIKGAGIIDTVVLASGGDAATAILYDGQDATGKRLLKICCIADDSKPVNFERKLCFHNGLYVALTGTAPVLSATIRDMPTGKIQA